MRLRRRLRLFQISFRRFDVRRVEDVPVLSRDVSVCREMFLSSGVSRVRHLLTDEVGRLVTGVPPVRLGHYYSRHVVRLVFVLRDEVRVLLLHGEVSLCLS